MVPHRPTVVYVGSVSFGLTIVEMSEEVLLRYVGGKYIREADYIPPQPSRYHVHHTWTTTRELPSGRLRLVAYSPYRRVSRSTEWQETKKTSLHSSIRTIVKSVENAAADLVAKLEEADRRAENARQEWLVAEEKRRRKEDQRRVEQSIGTAASTSARSFGSGSNIGLGPRGSPWCWCAQGPLPAPARPHLRPFLAIEGDRPPAEGAERDPLVL